MSTHVGPGISFMEMLLLTLKNHRQPSAFTPQIMMAIFCEETFFTNRRQEGGGPGVGFGQVEHQELPKLTTPEARQLGYAVPGVGSQTVQLDDDRAVQVASCFLLHLFHASKSPSVQGKKEFAYKGYGGVFAAKGTPLTAEERLRIIAGWKACEADLLALPFSEFQIVNFPEPIRKLEDKLIVALNKARRPGGKFDPELRVTRIVGGKATNPTIRELLFPRYWFFPGHDILALKSFLPSGTLLRQGSTGSQVHLLQKMLNAQPEPPARRLATDAIFGPRTHAAVQAFQAGNGLAADGIVGPMTRGALV